MVSQELNERLTRTGRGRPAGEVLRRYWQPAALVEELNGARPVVPVTLLGERLVLFRDNQGELGLIGRHCLHRGADLYFAPGDPASRVENRVADSTANPYFALAFQILSGLDGLENDLTPPPPLANPYDDDDAELLPRSLLAAIESFEASEMYRAALGDEFVSYLTRLKRAEWDRYLMTVSEWEHAEYFTAF